MIYIPITTAGSPQAVTGSNTHMALGQWLIRSLQYRQAYRKYHLRGDFIMVDNGAAEGDMPPFAEVVTVANWIGANEIALPDVLGDAQETVKAATSPEATSLVHPYRRMIIPQGDSLSSWLWCFDEIRSRLKHQYQTVGIPKHMSKVTMRTLLAKKVHRRDPSKQIHYLGLSANPIYELKLLAKETPEVRSVDSGAAIAWAQAQTQVTENETRYSLKDRVKPNDYLATHNIHLLQEVLNDSAH